MPGLRSARLFGLFTLGLALYAPAAPDAAQNAGLAPAFVRTACEGSIPTGYPADVTRECGYIVVPELRERPNGRTFRLAVIVYRATGPNGSPPLLLVHGGPDGIGGTRQRWREMQFPLVRNRDVVTYDMRGVGGSQPEFCRDFREDAAPAFNNRTWEDWEEAYRAAVRSCVASIDAQGLNRTAYGADVNAADAIDVRRALGYPNWDVYGVSYGGVVAQELLRLDPRGTHAAVLVSTVATGPLNATHSAVAYQRRMEAVFRSCAAQPSCRQAFPNLESDFYALHEELSAKPVAVVIPGASPPRSVWLNGERLMMELRRELFGAPTSIRRLPLLISELRRGNRDAARRRLIGNGEISPWGALGRIVQCNEYGADYRKGVAALRATLRLPFQIIADDFREHCDLWLPKPTRQADQRPVISDAPTLVLHGEFDQMEVGPTQKAITAQLKQAYAYTFPGESHANAPVGCHGSIVQQFLENPTRRPDASCLARMPGIVFKTRGLEFTATFLISDATDPQSPFAGEWEATLRGGPDWTFQIETKGKVVRGTVLEQDLQVYDGVVDGKKLSFKVNSPDRARAITFTGTLDGDRINFTRDVQIVTAGAPTGPGLFNVGGLPAFTAQRVR